MKKTILSSVIVLSFILYSFLARQRPIASELSINTPTIPTNTPSPTVPIPTDQPVANNSLPTATPTPSGKFRDGEYTGNAADAFYGNIQVKAIVRGGQLADVQFLQYPNDRANSIEINQYAMPILRQEAIQAQNAQVDIVSGATDSSQAFIESLRSALSQAI